MNYKEYKELLDLKKREIDKINNDYADSLNKKYEKYINKKVSLSKDGPICRDVCDIWFDGFYYNRDFCRVCHRFFRIRKDGTPSKIPYMVYIEPNNYDNLNFIINDDK